MPANNSGWLVHYWAGKYGGLGQLYSPGGSFRRPRPHLPHALDNGAYPAYSNGRRWNVAAFRAHLKRYAGMSLPPRFVVVPDVVMDAASTFKRWGVWAARIRDAHGFPLALAVQDGMTPQQVDRLSPAPDVVFVGGSSEWKWATVDMWSTEFMHVHVGRVNTGGQLARCAAAGVQSCDGSGWFRGDPEQTSQLGRFLAAQAGVRGAAIEVNRVVSESRLRMLACASTAINARGA